MSMKPVNLAVHQQLSAGFCLFETVKFFFLKQMNDNTKSNTAPDWSKNMSSRENNPATLLEWKNRRLIFFY